MQRKAEHRDRLQDRAEAEILRVFSHLRTLPALTN
jgi:hypothetical protein